MNKNINLYIFIFAIIFTISCNPKLDNNLEYTQISVDLLKGKIGLSSILTNVEPIFLETNDQSLIGMSPKIQFTNNLIFIRSDNAIKVFNFEGEFVRNIENIGRGPGEYVRISDFYINEYSKRIEILDKSQKKILSYSFEGEYIEDINLNLWSSSITINHEGSLIVYSGNERDDDNIYKLNIIDDGKRFGFDEIDEDKNKFLHISSTINFYETTNNDILFFEPFNDTIFTINNSEVTPKYTLSFNNDKANIPRSFYTNNKFSNVFEFFQDFNKYKYVNTTYNVIETNDNLRPLHDNPHVLTTYSFGI